MHTVELENFKINPKEIRHHPNCPFFLGGCHTVRFQKVAYTSTQFHKPCVQQSLKETVTGKNSV